MANSTAGQLGIIPGLGASAVLNPLRSASGDSGKWGARLPGADIRASGSLSISGTTKSVGVAAARRVVVMTQPPAARIVYEMATSLSNNAFLFAHLPPGNYTVMDFAPDNSRQALIYDWVVAG